MESLVAEDIIFLNARQINDTSESVPAKVVIHDNADIISRRQGYLATVTRFNISGQETLYYHPGSPDLTMEHTIWSGTVHAPLQKSGGKRTTLDNPMYTVSDMLSKLNLGNAHNGLTNAVVEFAVDASGRFSMVCTTRYMVPQPHPGDRHEAEAASGTRQINTIGTKHITSRSLQRRSGTPRSSWRRTSRIPRITASLQRRSEGWCVPLFRFRIT